MRYALCALPFAVRLSPFLTTDTTDYHTDSHGLDYQDKDSICDYLCMNLRYMWWKRSNLRYFQNLAQRRQDAKFNA